MDGFVRGQLFANIYIGVPYSTVIGYMTDNEVNPNVTFQIVAGQLPGGYCLMKRLVNYMERQRHLRRLMMCK